MHTGFFEVSEDLVRAHSTHLGESLNFNWTEAIQVNGWMLFAKVLE